LFWLLHALLAILLSLLPFRLATSICCNRHWLQHSQALALIPSAQAVRFCKSWLLLVVAVVVLAAHMLRLVVALAALAAAGAAMLGLHFLPAILGHPRR
jgi:hypothetical protein